MYFSSLNLLFFMSLIMGILLASTAPSWFAAWAGLELNLLSFIPLIVSSNTRYSSEAALKYFLIQALGSALIIFASSILLFSSHLFSIMMVAALLLKLGSAPFHFWFPQVMESLMWPQAIILMTLQKLAPLFILSYLINYQNIIFIMIMAALMSALIGAIGGINQLSLRKIMAFSSIGHMAWMLFACLMDENALVFYLFFYFIINISIAMIFHYFQSFSFNHIYNESNMTPVMKLVTFMSLLSLGGLPPFTGFLPKWILIQQMVNLNFYFLLMILLVSTLITLYYYVRVSAMVFNLSSFKLKHFSMKSKKLSVPFLISLNILGLMMPVCFMLF